MRQHSYLLLLSISAIGLGYLTTHVSAQGTSFGAASVLELIGSAQNASTNQQPPNLGLMKTWFQAYLRHLLPTVSKPALTCLSTGNFTCGMYQNIVSEISLHFSSLTPARQKFIYKHFMHPFLAREDTAGCVSAGESWEDWLKGNFGNFLHMAQYRDFIALNVDFDGLEVLHLLTPEQKAELLLHPEMDHLDNETLAMVFESLLKPLLTQSGSVGSIVPTPGQSQPNAVNLNSILETLQPLGNFMRSLMSFTLQANVTTLRSHMLVQALLNYTLADVAVSVALPPSFTVSSLDDWLQHVVTPLIRHFLPQNQTIPPGLLTAFSHVFVAISEPEPSDPLDICQLVDPHPCALANTVETLAKIFDSAGQTNLNVQHQGNIAIKLIEQHCKMDVGSVLCGPVPPPFFDSFPPEDFQDVNFTRVFFWAKIRPALPSIMGDSLRCLSNRNFSCQSYQALVMELSNHMLSLDEERQRSVYTDFIHPFLSRQTSADPACVAQTSGSQPWVTNNFNQFSVFALLQDFFSLNPNFSAVTALSHLSPRQMAELFFLPHPTLSDKKAIAAAVVHLFMESPDDKKAVEFLGELVMLSQQANLSCDSYETILSLIDQAVMYESSEVQAKAAEIRVQLAQQAMLYCSINEVLPGCMTTEVNETRICAGINSSAVRVENTAMMCENDLRHYACLQPPTNLTSEHVAGIVYCSLRDNMMPSKETWKLFFTKASGVLHEALVIFAGMNPSLNRTSAMPVLDVIAESLDAAITSASEDVSLIAEILLEFQNFKPFLPFVSPGLLSCLSTKNFSCQTFQVIVMTLSEKYEEMDQHQQFIVYTYFIQVFLSRTDTQDPGCVHSSNGTVPWLQMNFGRFAGFLNLRNIQRLNRNFSVLEALPHLTVKQLAEVAATPGSLGTTADVNRLMNHVPHDHLGMFFDEFILSNLGQPLPAEVGSAMLQQVLDRANLSAVSDAAALVWLQRRLPAVVANMRAEHVGPVFTIVRHRDCNVSHEVVTLLSGVRPTLANDTEGEVKTNILLSLREPAPLRCYPAPQSFYQFVKESFLEFPTPELSTFLSLMPPNRQAELINSMSRPELAKLLKSPRFVDNGTDLCTVLRLHAQTPALLDQETFPGHVASQVLPCVWPLALRSVTEAEVSLWFNALRNYVGFLNNDLISSPDTLNASCLAFKALIFVLGSNFDFGSTDIREDGVYEVIKTYLSTDGSPKCYSPSDPTLNSTAWFFNYFCNFLKYGNLDDFKAFGSEEVLQVFSVNPQNIYVLGQPGVPEDVVSLYTELIYRQDPRFSPMQLPPTLLCHVPGEVFSRLDENQTLAVLSILNQSCSAVELMISAALAGNFERLSPEVLRALGQEVTGLSIAQISAAPPSVLIGSLELLGGVSGWKLSQSIAIVNVLLDGNYQINSQENLLKLGSLIGGVPSASISSISPDVARQTAANQEFVANLMSAPPVVRETLVSQIIQVDPAPQVLLDNVPNELATEIPRSLLSFPSTMDPAVVQKINQKRWKPEQAALFFETIAGGLSDADGISTDVLQGFSCTRIQTLGEEKVRDLIRACRRRDDRRKVVLQESQLICMYNHIKQEKPQNFRDYPSDMLLYYDYSNVQQATCKSYFMEMGNANFDVLSETLSKKKVDLMNNARSCLGITGTHLNGENVEVLGSMCCTLDESYINASDPAILEELKHCRTLSDQQLAAVETVLLRGATEYGNPSEWNFQTLESLGPLPIELGNSFWSHFRERDVERFLRKLQKQDQQERGKREALFEVLDGTRFRRAADQCTVGNITHVTISDGAFPLGYDASQFRHCLSVEVVRDNLAGLAAKVDVDEFQEIVLNKLNQALPSGLSDEQVRILGPLSRVATAGDIDKWNVTTVDSLAALMDARDGEWEPAKSEAIVTKYLATPGNTLGTQELNAIGGPNLCSLTTSVLMTITPDSLKSANPFNVAACPEGLKNQLFSIAEQAFNESDPISMTTYQLIQSYLGGAPKDYILRLSRANVSMDVLTFTSLSTSVVTSLSVMEVRSLLGANVDDMKTYENETTIQAWIRSRDQSALDSLSLGLIGGQEIAVTTVGQTMSTAHPGPDTTSGHEGTRPPSTHQLSLFLGVTFVILQLLK